MKAKVFLPLLMSLLATPALASDAFESLFAGPGVQVAQMGPEARRMMRERWEQSSPEERMELRRQFQERLQQGPGFEREQWGSRPPRPSDFPGMGGNFGTGFEQRGPVPGMDDGAPRLDPRDRFTPPAGRYRR